jgi:hypothetical protein
VAVLDPRLATARYGSFLMASLPPFWHTTDPAVVRAALSRINAGQLSAGQSGAGREDADSAEVHPSGVKSAR